MIVNSIIRNTGIESDLKGDTPDECVKSINTLTKAIGDCKRKTNYYSAQQGFFLQSLKIQAKERLKQIKISSTHKCFLIRFYNLVNEYNELMYCELPLNVFYKNFKAIKQVCQNDPQAWK